eukprot:scaffold142729_cov22-Tisochrysis_lutea.AAC.1
MQLPGTLVFDYPTTEAVVRLIASSLPAQPSSSALQRSTARKGGRHAARHSAAYVKSAGEPLSRGFKASKGGMVVAPPEAAVVGMCVQAATGEHGLAHGFSSPLCASTAAPVAQSGPLDGVGCVPLARCVQWGMERSPACLLPPFASSSSMSLQNFSSHPCASCGGNGMSFMWVEASDAALQFCEGCPVENWGVFAAVPGDAHNAMCAKG